MGKHPNQVAGVFFFTLQCYKNKKIALKTKKLLRNKINRYILVVSEDKGEIMKTTQEIIERLQERFVRLEECISVNLMLEEEQKKLHHWKSAKLYTELLIEYNAEQREVVRMYAFIKGIDFVDGCHELFDLTRKENQ